MSPFLHLRLLNYGYDAAWNSPSLVEAPHLSFDRRDHREILSRVAFRPPTDNLVGLLLLLYANASKWTQMI
jgi:hypothetical protein